MPTAYSQFFFGQNPKTTIKIFLFKDVHVSRCVERRCRGGLVQQRAQVCAGKIFEAVADVSWAEYKRRVASLLQDYVNAHKMYGLMNQLSELSEYAAEIFAGTSCPTVCNLSTFVPHFLPFIHSSIHPHTSIHPPFQGDIHYLLQP